MKTLYLIRHSIKNNDYYDESLSIQENDELKKLTLKGEDLALELSETKELQNIDEIWASSYTRAIETAKYIARGKKINISKSFDERHYGDFPSISERKVFWKDQFLDENLKYPNGESQVEVRNRVENKINEILETSTNDRIAIVTHNACTLFYLLKYCDLISAELPKKITMKYNDKLIMNESIMSSPSVMKLTFDNKELKNIEYFEIHDLKEKEQIKVLKKD